MCAPPPTERMAAAMVEQQAPLNMVAASRAQAAQADIQEMAAQVAILLVVYTVTVMPVVGAVAVAPLLIHAMAPVVQAFMEWDLTAQAVLAALLVAAVPGAHLAQFQQVQGAEQVDFTEQAGVLADCTIL